MEIKKQNSKQELSWEIVLSPGEFEPYKEKALKALTENMELPGFRKGKVPPDKAKEHVSREKVLAEAAFLATRTVAADILSKEQEEWLGQPEINVKGLDENNGLSFDLKCIAVPQIDLNNWQQKITVKKIVQEVKAEEIEKALEQLQKSRAVYRAVNRSAQKGDFVEVSFSGRSGGVQVEGLNSQKHPFILGEGRFVDGFEDQIIGLSVGDDKIFTLTVSGDWMHKNIAGKEIEFSVKLETLQERLLPEISDEFAKSLGNFSDISEFRASIGEGLLVEKEKNEQKSLRVKALEQIMDAVLADIPDILRKQEAERLLQELRASVESGGLVFEEYLAQIGKSKEAMEKDFARGAEKRVKAALVLKALAKELGIEPTEEEIVKCTNEQLAREDSLEDVHKIDPEERKAYCRSIIRNEKVFEALEVIAEEK